MFNIFKFNENIITEFYFHSSSIVINQTFKIEFEEKLLIQNTLALMVHYFAITNNELQLIIFKEYLQESLKVGFTNTTIPNNPNEKNLKKMYSLIVENFSDIEKKALMGYFGGFPPTYSIEEDIFIELLKNNNLERENKPKYGKYTFKFKMLKNKPLFKLDISSGKDKILLPLAIFALINNTFDKIINKQSISNAIDDFLNNYANNNNSIFKTESILINLYEKHLN